MIRVTRGYPFSAAHVLARSDWSEQRNREVYGRCANPAGHGHNYLLEVTLRGEVDPATGRLVPLERLDRLVRARILDRLDHRFLNREVPEFEHVVPTAENIAVWIWDRLKPSLPQLWAVRVYETADCWAEYLGR